MLLSYGYQPFSLISKLPYSRCCQAVSFKYVGTTLVKKFLSFLYHIFLVIFLWISPPTACPVSSLKKPCWWFLYRCQVHIPFSVTVILVMKMQ